METNNDIMVKRLSIIGMLSLFILASSYAYCDNHQVCDQNMIGNLTLSVVNDTSGSLILGCDCSASIYTTGYSSLMNISMQGLASGYYIAALNASTTGEVGVHPLTYSCSCPGRNVTTTTSYEVVGSRVLDYITDPSSDLYTNIWAFSSRSLSYDGIVSLAQAMWNSTITGLRKIDVVPILQTVQGRYGEEQQMVPSDQIIDRSARWT
jgi:hypothetical protein